LKINSFRLKNACFFVRVKKILYLKYFFFLSEERDEVIRKKID
jgi:hypothetical protein